MDEPRQGKCERCEVVFTWIEPPKLMDSWCPRCGEKLKRTTYLKKWPRRLQYPVDEAAARRLRWEVAARRWKERAGD